MSNKNSRKTHFRNIPTTEYYLEKIRSKLPSNLNVGEINGLMQYDIEKLNDIKKIHDIDEIIARMYDLDPDENNTTRVVRKLTGFGDEVVNWDVIFSSGNNFDCLIHSFLTATCNNFRRLVQRDKDEFANFFRRKIFLNLPVVLCYRRNDYDEYERLETRVMGKEFLEDFELFILAAQFKVQFLSASSRGGAIGNQFYLIYAEAIKNVLPAECCEWRNNNQSTKNWPIFCIYTNMVHFEAIRINGRYTINEMDTALAMSSLENSRPENSRNKSPRTKSCNKCTFNNPINSKTCEMCRHKIHGGTRKRQRQRRGGQATRRI